MLPSVPVRGWRWCQLQNILQTAPAGGVGHAYRKGRRMDDSRRVCVWKRDVFVSSYCLAVQLIVTVMKLWQQRSGYNMHTWWPCTHRSIRGHMTLWVINTLQMLCFDTCEATCGLAFLFPSPKPDCNVKGIFLLVSWWPPSLVPFLHSHSVFDGRCRCIYVPYSFYFLIIDLTVLWGIFSDIFFHFRPPTCANANCSKVLANLESHQWNKNTVVV